MFRATNEPGKACGWCGETFYRDKRNTRAYWQRAKYCCQDCAGKANSKRLESQRPDKEEKFRRHYEETDSCWEWTWLTDKDGYGLFPYAGKQHRAHVLALELAGTPVPKGMYACHHCDNPRCVRPDHLYVGTPRQNMADARARGRTRTGERNHGARLTEDDVRAIRAASGTNREIAATYGVATSNVSLIRNRRTWRHVP